MVEDRRKLVEEPLGGVNSRFCECVCVCECGEKLVAAWNEKELTN